MTKKYCTTLITFLTTVLLSSIVHPKYSETGLRVQAASPIETGDELLTPTPEAASQTGLMSTLETAFPNTLFGIDIEVVLLIGGTLMVLVALVIIIIGTFSKRKKKPRTFDYEFTEYDDIFGNTSPQNIRANYPETSLTGANYDVFSNASPHHAAFHGLNPGMQGSASPLQPAPMPHHAAFHSPNSGMQSSPSPLQPAPMPHHAAFHNPNHGMQSGPSPLQPAPMPPHAAFHSSNPGMPSSAAPRHSAPIPPRTAPTSANYDMHDQAKTEYLGAAPAHAGFTGAGFTIKISTLGGIGKTWNLPVRNDILIGRAAHNTILLDDTSVAREQCKIVIHGTQLVLVNLSKTNITILNGAIVSEAVPLKTGDTMVLGREVLRVDHIESPGMLQPMQHTPPSSNIGYTESIF